MTGPPPIDAARPKRCIVCEVDAGVCGRLAIVGHGVRTRQVRGPQMVAGPPKLAVIFVRRFLCLSCDATMTVAPLEVQPWHLYALPVIFWAIALFGLDALGAADVRRRSSPDVFVAAGSASRWRQLGRWIDRFCEATHVGDPRRRDRARALALRLAAKAGPGHALNSGAAWIGATMSIAPQP